MRGVESFVTKRYEVKICKIKSINVLLLNFQFRLELNFIVIKKGGKPSGIIFEIGSKRYGFIKEYTKKKYVLRLTLK